MIENKKILLDITTTTADIKIKYFSNVSNYGILPKGSACPVFVHM